ncbi:hypothetical protein Tco_1218186 [Tanacetum coccineum]
MAVGKINKHWIYQTKISDVAEDVGMSTRQKNSNFGKDVGTNTIVDQPSSTSNRFNVLDGFKDAMVNKKRLIRNDLQEIEDVEVTIDDTTTFMTKASIDLYPASAEYKDKTIILGLPEDIYAAVDSCETAQEIWLRVQKMMKGSDIGIQEKKTKLFNE